MRNVIAEGVTRVGAGVVGLVDLVDRAAGSVESPADLFQIEDQFAAARVNVEMDIACRVAQPGVDAVYAVAHGRVAGGSVEGWRVKLWPLCEELANQRPICTGGGGAALVAAGISVDFNKKAMCAESPSALVKGLTGEFSIGIRFNDDFIENVC